MRISLRRTGLITGLLLIAAPFAAPAQQSCNPPAQPKLDWMGTQTGCRPSSSSPSVVASPPCAVGEVINFKALPVAGSFQSCDRFAWNFGDPAEGFASVQNPPYVYLSPSPPTFPFTVSVGVFTSDGNGATSASGPITLTVQPVFIKFIATPPKVILGQPVVLSWETRDTTGVRIDQLTGTLSSSGSKTIVPVVTTTYTLTLFGDAGEKSCAKVSDPAVCAVTVDVTPNRHRSVRH